jgi:hypothetical protein
MRLASAGAQAPAQHKAQPAPGAAPQQAPRPSAAAPGGGAGGAGGAGGGLAQQQQQQQQQQAAAAAAALGLPRQHPQAPLNNWLPPASGKERVRAMNLEPVLWRLVGGPDGVTASEVTLPEPVPLAVMVDLLSDLWEAEGLTDQ